MNRNTKLKGIFAALAITPLAACAHAPQLYNAEGESYHYEETYQEGDARPRGEFRRMHYDPSHGHSNSGNIVRQDVDVNVDQRNRQRAQAEANSGLDRPRREAYDWKLYSNYRERLSPLEGDIVYGDKNLYFGGGDGISEDDYYELRTEELKNQYNFLQRRNQRYYSH